nr:NPCBM/NEW2 domain-containing protein [uncultured Emticicia sp.]
MKFVVTFTLLIFTSLFSIGQISITFPMEKAVFQRSLNNSATINIAGNYSSNITSVEARFINVQNGQVTIAWTTLTNNLNGGIFSGSVSNVPGGWYTVELRGKSGTNIVATTSLNKVGVGEVFLIAGQSNAQGLAGNQGEVGATEERVLCHNEVSWYDSNIGQCDKKTPSYPSFSQIFSDYLTDTRSFLSKTGFNPWCYGKLGDDLVRKLDVPVVFFNAGATATTSFNWKESSAGQETKNIYTDVQYCGLVGAPYVGLERIINYYASIFGVRAILWHQGESDNYASTSESDYFSNIIAVINKTRSELGNIPWVISRASTSDQYENGGLGNPNYNIINAQNSLVSISNQVFPGPSTDDILGSNRWDYVHFYGGGLIELAKRWDAALNYDFFNNSRPLVAQNFPQVTTSLQPTNELRITAPTGYSAYKWVRLDIGNEDYEDATEASSQSIDRSSGTYRCYVSDAQGNITFTQPVTVIICEGLKSCSGITYLSDNQPCSSSNTWGPIEMDKSNGENGTGDGTTIKIKGVSYQKGIGVHANATISYRLNKRFGQFISTIGIDDEVATANIGATVIFKVYKDNVLSYTSATVDRNSSAIKLNIDVKGVNELKLEVSDAGDGNFADHADWANARLHCVDTQAPSSPTALSGSLISQNCVTLSWNNSTDNMEVERYDVYRNGTFYGSVEAPSTTLKVTGLSSQLNPYQFVVKAIDYSGNVSNQSNLIEIVTLQNMIIDNSKKIIQKGESSSLFASGCAGGTVTWSNGSTSNPLVVSPIDTTIYSATCKIGDCTSLMVKDTVKVIPDCKNFYIFSNNKDNYTGASTYLTFNASQTINANNIISSGAKANYIAAKSITLLPGFSSTIGTVFNAKIAGCPNSQSTPTPSADNLEAAPIIETKLRPSRKFTQ